MQMKPPLKGCAEDSILLLTLALTCNYLPCFKELFPSQWKTPAVSIDVNSSPDEPELCCNHPLWEHKDLGCCTHPFPWAARAYSLPKSYIIFYISYIMQIYHQKDGICQTWKRHCRTLAKALFPHFVQFRSLNTAEILTSIWHCPWLLVIHPLLYSTHLKKEAE